MGATGVKIVAANLTVVKPRNGRAYIRSKTNLVVSDRLAKFHNCVGNAMTGQGGDKAALREKFANAARQCAHGGRSSAPAAGRRMSRRF